MHNDQVAYRQPFAGPRLDSVAQTSLLRLPPRGARSVSVAPRGRMILGERPIETLLGGPRSCSQWSSCNIGRSILLREKPS